MGAKCIPVVVTHRRISHFCYVWVEVEPTVEQRFVLLEHLNSCMTWSTKNIHMAGACPQDLSTSFEPCDSNQSRFQLPMAINI